MALHEEWGMAQGGVMMGSAAISQAVLGLSMPAQAEQPVDLGALHEDAWCALQEDALCASQLELQALVSLLRAHSHFSRSHSLIWRAFMATAFS